jgi:type IVB pilus formation R64 PilN family outer membrane protein
MKKSLISLAVGIACTACSSTALRNESQSEVDTALKRSAIVTAKIGIPTDGATRGSAEYADNVAKEQSAWPVMRRSKSAWIGSQMVPVTNDDRLPSIFKKEFVLSFDDKKAGKVVSLSTVVARLTSITRVPVRIHPDVTSTPSTMTGSGPHGPGFGQPIPAPPQVMLPSSGGLAPPLPLSERMASASSAPGQPTIDAGEMKWNGTLTAFLNNLTDRLGLAWEYRDNTVVIMRFVTESHEIATFNGETQYTINTGGGSNGTTGGNGAQTTSNNQLGINETGKSDPAMSIEKAVEKMVSSVPGSAVTRSEGSGRLLVKTSREMQSQVRDYIKAENSSMLRQAQIQFDIYSVRTEDTDEQGVNWNVIFKSMSNLYGVNVGSPSSLATSASAQMGLNILSAGSSQTARTFGDSAAILNLLSQFGTSVQHRPVSLLALNRTWARKSRLNTEGYLAETTPGPASSTGIGAPGLKTDKITTGDQYVAQPQILDNNTVLLKFGVSLSDLLGLFDVTSGTGTTMQKVQTPKVSAVNDQYSVALQPGQVMAITGLSRLVTTTDQRTLSESAPIGLGGSKRVNMLREHFVIFVRPIIL